MGQPELPVTESFLASNGLNDLLSTVRVIVKYVASTKWYGEIAELGLGEELSDTLLDALTADAGL